MLNTSGFQPAPGPVSDPIICLRHVTKRFDTGYLALDDFSLAVERGRFVALVGPSGCGKSTTLSLIAGLEAPTGGAVEVRGTPLEGVCQNIGFLFQRDALLPWKSVLGNVALPLALRGVGRNEINARCADWIARVGLRGFEKSYPHQLSGGMRKRASLAQTLVYDPDVVLMDEPFAALDVQTRNLMEDELLSLWQGTGKTIVFVTHDLEEAIALADQVTVMTAGPGRVKASYDVNLERPRSVPDARFDPRFTALYSSMWGDLRDEVLKSYAREQAS